MSETITVTTLVEDTVNLRGLRAEHGLAVLICTGGRQILFDTGQSDLIAANAAQLSTPLAGTQAIVLSHGHYDHTGGLPAVLPLAPTVRLFAHPAVLAPKFARDTHRNVRPVGLPAASAQALRENGVVVVNTTGFTEIFDGIFVTGEIPQRSDFEDTGGAFFLDEAGTQPDLLRDDQALFFDTRDGLVVILGCAHAGVVNTLDHVRRHTNGRPIHTVIGGMHLLFASPERLEKTIAALRDWNVQRIVPGHCTGPAAVARLWTAFPGRCGACVVGTRFVFER